ncbi:hypothetical protein T484DRAFT_1931113 [Baffinella frigidus]|nr:hypothetical protein T484DRAFT_1931113 [Cryptophyta sp. CCMP2293]
MIGRTAKMVRRGVLLACLLAAAEGAPTPGMRAPRRLWSDDSSMHSLPSSPPSSSLGIAGGHDSRVLPIRRSTSHARRLSCGAQDDSVYEPVQQRGRKWSPEPVTSPPPLLSDRPDGAHTFIKTKLYPHLPF